MLERSRVCAAFIGLFLTAWIAAPLSGRGQQSGAPDPGRRLVSPAATAPGPGLNSGRAQRLWQTTSMLLPSGSSTNAP